MGDDCMTTKRAKMAMTYPAEFTLVCAPNPGACSSTDERMAGRSDRRIPPGGAAPPA
ncbi:MAG: ATP-binding protein [Candidatus Brocadiia bacterium]